MDSEILGIVGAIAGVIVGGLITAFTSIYIQRKNFNYDLYCKKLNLCVKALEYIRILYKSERQEQSLPNSDFRSTLKEEGKTFKEFYDQLILLSSDKFKRDFQSLRNEIQAHTDKGLSYFVERGEKIMKRELQMKTKSVFTRRQNEHESI